MDVRFRLPVEWQDLFRQLHHSVDRAVTWYLNEQGSQYGRALVWFQLLQALSRLDPCIQNRQLAFKPMFCHLEEKIQKNFLTFLEDVGASIPNIYISEFLKNIQRSSYQTVWLDQALEKLKTAFKIQYDTEDVKQEKESSTKDEQTFEDFPTFTDTNVSKVELSHKSEDEDVIILDEEPPTKRVRIEHDNDGTTLETRDQGETSDGLGKHLDGDNEYVDRVNINNSFVEEEDGVKELREEYEQFDKDDIVRTIKESWQAGSGDVLTDEQRDKILSFSQKEMELFCSYVELETMSDDCVDSACRSVCQMSEVLSYGSVVSLLKSAIFSKLKDLSQNASRKFTGTVTLVTETFPKQVIDAVIVPELNEVNITALQVDLVGRLVKGSLNSACKLYFLQQLIVDNFSLTEIKIPILQALCESTCALDIQTFGKILTMLDRASDNLSKNLKFGKLLLALVNKHKNLINKETYRMLGLIVDKHDTFLKKSIHAALSKIKI